ncbi:MAG TPA: phage tail protein [Xanthobacteraceae bacterium]|nr:phage tail protein [Xanthobacteraceae bacterium]
MAIIAVAIVGALASAAITGMAVVTALTLAGLSIGLSYAAKALTKTKASSVASTSGVQTSLQTGGDVPRGSVFGKQGVAGQLIYFNTYGADNAYLEMVFAIGDGLHDGIDAVWVDGVRKTITRTSSSTYAEHYTVDGFTGFTLDFYLGKSGQTADANLVTNANPAGRWTSDFKLTGISYIICRLKYDADLYPQGVPQFLFEVRGRRLYDIRKDDTAGGSGAHRWDDETTWEFSENPIVQLYNFRRGLYVASQLVVGCGVAPVDLVPDYFMAAATACDEIVGSNPRFRCGTYVSADEQYGDVVTRFLEACAGVEQERAGAFAPIAGVAQSLALPDPITDDDIVSGQPVKFSAKQSRASLFNAVFGIFTDPSQQWKQVAYPPNTNSDDEATDGERLVETLDLPQIPYVDQAQRLSEIARRLARLQATATITLPYKFVVLEPGDWIQWNSALYGNRTWMVTQATLNADHTNTVALREISSDAYSDVTPAAGPAVGTLPTVATRLSTAPSFSIGGSTILGAGGLKIQAIVCNWTPILDLTVDRVIVEYRIHTDDDSGAVMTASFSNVLSGQGVISAGIQASTEYDVRATIETTPERATTFTAWQQMTTGAEHVVPSATGAVPVDVQLTSFDDALQDLVRNRIMGAINDLTTTVAALALAVANQDSSNALDKQELKRSISASYGNALAAFNEAIIAAVGPGGSVVELLDELQATLDDGTALGTASFIVGVTPSGAVASYELTVMSNNTKAGLKVATYDDGHGGHTSQVLIEADQFQVGSTADGVGFMPLFIVSGGEVLINGDIIATGTITADKLSVATLSAIVANVGLLTAGMIQSADGKLQLDLDNNRLVISD